MDVYPNDLESTASYIMNRIIIENDLGSFFVNAEIIVLQIYLSVMKLIRNRLWI